MRRLLTGVVFAIILSGTAVAGPWEDGVDAYKRGDYATALELWQPLVAAGDPRAENNLGVMYEKGLGVPVNLDLAASWYLKAAEHGHAGAKENLVDLIAKRAAEAEIPAADRIKELDEDIRGGPGL